MFHFCAPLLICYSKHRCQYTQFVHLNSSTFGVFLTIIFILSLIPIFVFKLNALPSLCKFDILSTAINILSEVPLRRTEFMGRRENLISCVSGMRSERQGTENYLQRDVWKRGAQLPCTISDPMMLSFQKIVFLPYLIFV